jgi:hypothetical protein
MSTTNVESWAVDLANVGAIYPMVGTEVILWIIGMAFWIIWHVWQAKFESDTYNKDLQKYGTGDAIQKVLNEQATGGRSDG